MPRDMKASFDLLKALIPFDAAQLLRVERGERPTEVFRTGYSSNTAWALAHMFPMKRPGGFTQYASADAPLPPTISTSVIRSEFTSSRLFRDYLSEEGYAEGMTLELFSATEPVGLAHFSSRTAYAFEGAPRKAALAVSGLLGQLITLLPVPKVKQWPASNESGLEEHRVKPLVRLANKLRDLKGQDLEEGVSTRLVVYAATLVRQGMPVERAILAAMIEPLTDDRDTKRGLLDLVTAVFG